MNPVNLSKNIIRASPYTIHQTALLAYIVTKNDIYLYFFLLSLAGGEALNMLLQKIIFRANFTQASLRPQACGNDMRGCGVFAENNCSIGSVNNSGLPSRHVQVAALAATFWSIYLMSDYNAKKASLSTEEADKLKSDVNIKITILAILVAVICLERIFISKCNNFAQVLAGLIIGVVCAFIGYPIISTMTDNLPDLSL